MSCNALSRDTELVKTEPDVRKARKHLLSELGVLASLAKKAHTMSNVELTEDTELEIDALGEAIQARTERLVNRANRLLEIATPLTELWKEEDMYIPPTPPVSGGSFDFSDQSAMNWEFSSSMKGRQASVATSGADSLGSVSSTLSEDSLAASQVQSNWALARLNATHDTLLSHLAAYIGRLHLQSRSPGQIFETTNLCVIAARNFLGVVRAITGRKGNRLSSTGALEQSSNLLWTKCTTLVNVAREVVSTHGVGGDAEDEDVVMDAEVKKLVEAATACVRSAGECVALGHCQLEAMGDFELPPAALKLNRDSLISLVPADEYPGARRGSIPITKNVSKRLPPPPLSDDNPRRPLPPPPRTESPVRKTPPTLKLVSSHAYRTSRSPSPVPSTGRQFVASPISPGQVLKQRDTEAQTRFLATFQSHSPLSVETDVVETLQVPEKPEIVEPRSETPDNNTRPLSTHVRQTSHPQLRRDSLFLLSSDEALRLADTLTMPRIASSSSSSNESAEGDVGDESLKSIPTTPEPVTPIQTRHPLDWNEASKTVILNADGHVFSSKMVLIFRLWVLLLKDLLRE